MKNKIVRVGLGFDSHRLTPSDSYKNKIKLCGIEVPCSYKIIAHSDGDLVLHAITDAILGAIGKGDIGDYFPPTDEKCKDENSEKFLSFAFDLLKKQNGIINNVDIVIITETPKIGPHKNIFVNKLSELLSIKPDQVNIKAKTAEGIGSIGRKEKIACHVVISLLL